MITADQRSLVFEPLGEDAWRLCDTAVDEGDAARLVAYVERLDTRGYEAIWLGFGVHPSVHASREEVLRAAQQLRHAEPPSTRSKPIPIPHLSPERVGHQGWG